MDVGLRKVNEDHLLGGVVRDFTGVHHAAARGAQVRHQKRSGEAGRPELEKSSPGDVRAIPRQQMMVGMLARELFA
jgi:hypothetical protein